MEKLGNREPPPAPPQPRCSRFPPFLLTPQSLTCLTSRSPLCQVSILASAVDREALGFVDTQWPTAALGPLWSRRPSPWNLSSSLPVLQGGLNLQPTLLFVGQTVNGPAPGGLEPGSRLPGMRKEYPVGHYLGPTGISPCIKGGEGGGKGRDKETTGNRECLYSATRAIRSPGKRLLGEAG